jgi:hypothetical protein
LDCEDALIAYELDASRSSRAWQIARSTLAACGVEHGLAETLAGAWCVPAITFVKPST